MKSFVRTPLFWALFILVSGIAGIIALYYFPKSNPIIHLNLTMNRSQAIDAAQTIATQFAVGPANSSSAAEFETDELVKTFIELEAGGKDALVAMMEHNFYQPYQWKVRRFKSFEHHEVFIYFMPDGTPYGFKETISENTPGTNVTLPAAQKIAEAFAQVAPWKVNFKEYTLVETSQEVRPSNRLDHFFTYERINEKIGEGFYRLKISVSGDHVSELSPIVKVPDAFIQRYNQMRSTNEIIYYIATVVMFLLYIIGCSLIGLFVLGQERFIIWRTPFYWGLFIAILAALNIPNQLPLAWMEYNTAYSPIAFLIQHQGIAIVYSLIVLSIAFSFVFMAAESLSRRAFGHHVQLWHAYNRFTASSYTMLGYTITGYLLVPIMLCYTILFYVVTMKWLGWWSPSSALFNPNILATYLPWLQSISESLQAGFLEECLFRAIPLATAALLGNKFGKRAWWIAGAFIIQAIVFGAAHANYPQQPAYARVVELFGVSVFFGTIYLWLGLVPGIITHFIIDVFWFSLPIFVSTAPGTLFNKIIIILLALIPLFIIIIARLKTGAWHTISSTMLNSAWQAPVAPPLSKQQRPAKKLISLRKSILYSLYSLGIIGFIVWCMATQFVPDVPSFSISRNDVTQKSKEFLRKHYNVDPSTWYLGITPFIHYENLHDWQKEHRFIWQEGGKDRYHQLLDFYLMPPHWIARFMKFEGPLIDRAEDYEFDFKPDGSFLRYIHTLPEAKPGVSLSQEAAEQRAIEAIEKQFHLTANQLHKISAVADKQPERLDWTMTYSSSAHYPLTKGEGRIVIKVTGDEISTAWKYIHIPEEWDRAEENRILIATIIKQLCKLATWIIVMIGACIAIAHWQMYPLLSSLWIFLILASIFLFELFNSWPFVVINFNTSQPFYHQAFRYFTGRAILLILRAAAMAIAFIFVTYTPILYQGTSRLRSMLCGISCGTLISCIVSLLIYCLPSLEPAWPNYTPLQFLLPFTAGINSIILNYFSLTLLLFLCIICMNTLTHYGKQRKIPGIVLSIILGYLSAGLLFPQNIFLCTITGLSFTLFFQIMYYLVLRFDYAMIPIITATYVILENTQQFFFNGYPLAQFVAILSSCIIAIIAWLWSKKLHAV